MTLSKGRSPDRKNMQKSGTGFMAFRVNEHSDTETIKDLFVEYSHIKGAESCFVSFDKDGIVSMRINLRKMN